MDEKALSESKKAMDAICAEIQKMLPPSFVFLLLVTSTAQPPGDARANYASTMTRETAIATMKEFLLKAGAAEDWMKDIE